MRFIIVDHASERLRHELTVLSQELLVLLVKLLFCSFRLFQLFLSCASINSLDFFEVFRDGEFGERLE